ncbi:RNA polymerase sigma-70 factor [Paenibacillus sp. 1P03SA]|uniref:RNA polymerase sigma-70 factor n=1 Tax=Paenibacillus sp. 1P03SA TaxID=3132294 RepID=UPI0039A03EB4
METERLSTEQLYTAYKPLLFSLAYRLLGSVMDAEDIVQEAFLSMNGASAAKPIENPKAYLCKIATNLCIDRLRSPSYRREAYIGPWLPEPLVEGAPGADDPAESLVLRESLSTAYLLLLHQLTWVERVVFLLRESLQYDYDEIASIVGKSSTNCRQIFHRAKRSLGSHALPPEEPAVPGVPNLLAFRQQTGRLVDRFVNALKAGDTAGLLAALADEAVLYSDGGGKVSAAVRPIIGADRIARFFAGLIQKFGREFSRLDIVHVNGLPGLASYSNGKLSSVVSFHCEEDHIAAIYIVINPDKLRHLSHIQPE